MTGGLISLRPAAFGRGPLAAGGLHSPAPTHPVLQRALKDTHGGEPGSAHTAYDTRSSTEFDADDPILCRACSRGITSVAAAIAVSGSHHHRFINPAGLTYRIGCFSAAPGCMVYGRPTMEFTWFSGFAWSLAFCRNCYLHLGWHYQSPERSFFGLILDNLAGKARTH